MCGRYTQGRAIPNLIERYLDLGGAIVASEQTLHPSYNIAPGTYPAVLFSEEGKLKLGPMRWGLVPRWTKSLADLKHKPINAQSETADSGAFFRDAFKHARCLVPATSFYEWKGAKPPKQPYCICVKDQEVFSMAGLWSRWRGPEGEDLVTFAVLTTAPNALMKTIHNRMPCILRREDEKVWMDGTLGDTAVLKEVLRAYPAEQMEAYPVSTAVNRPGVDGPDLMARVAVETPGAQQDLFG